MFYHLKFFGCFQLVLKSAIKTSSVLEPVLKQRDWVWTLYPIFLSVSLSVSQSFSLTLRLSEKLHKALLSRSTDTFQKASVQNASPLTATNIEWGPWRFSLSNTYLSTKWKWVIQAGVNRVIISVFTLQVRQSQLSVEKGTGPQMRWLMLNFLRCSVPSTDSQEYVLQPGFKKDITRTTVYIIPPLRPHD